LNPLAADYTSYADLSCAMLSRVYPNQYVVNGIDLDGNSDVIHGTDLTVREELITTVDGTTLLPQFEYLD
jgi:hypothetical protein